ncbi:MAG TPA: protein-L-isoaspartate(D-aspartate) O-methyltransferase [Terriglobia bacterium]|nr:protein-L-isoaspartate(D-aspartate) O-methyltransferase [Terriglobia bacterium]
MRKYFEIATLLTLGLATSGAQCQPGPVAAEQSQQSDLDQARNRMVDEQIKARGIKDARVLDAMRSVPRHEFVPEAYRTQAYADSPLPTSSGQTISQPYIVALMTELADPRPEHRVLEVGTGSGYQAAILSRLVRDVYTVELLPELAKTAAQRLERLGFRNVRVREGDGYLGWAEHAPFDAILVTAGAREVPKPLVEQLKPGGKMIIPVDSSAGDQTLQVLEKAANGTVRVRDVIPVRFVPLVRR